MTYLGTDQETVALMRTALNNDRPADTAELLIAAEIGCDKVEEICGPILATSRTETVAAGRSAILSARVASLTSVSAGDVAEYSTVGQLLTRTDGAAWSSPLTITYLTGSATVPAWAKAAALAIARQYWRGKITAAPGSESPTGTGFLVPNQARELMADHELIPDGFA